MDKCNNVIKLVIKDNLVLGRNRKVAHRNITYCTCKNEDRIIYVRRKGNFILKKKKKHSISKVQPNNSKEERTAAVLKVQQNKQGKCDVDGNFKKTKYEVGKTGGGFGSGENKGKWDVKFLHVSEQNKLSNIIQSKLI